MLENCVCCSDKPMSKCCGLFLSQEKVAKTPVQLMRSRYSSYVLGGYGDYLLATWLPSMSKGLTSTELSVRSVDWVSLTIVAKSQQGNNGYVEFNAYFLNKESNERSMPRTRYGVQNEKSVFRRINGRWYYVGGEVA